MEATMVEWSEAAGMEGDETGQLEADSSCEPMTWLALADRLEELPGFGDRETVYRIRAAVLFASQVFGDELPRDLRDDHLNRLLDALLTSGLTYTRALRRVEAVRRTVKRARRAGWIKRRRKPRPVLVTKPKAPKPPKPTPAKPSRVEIAAAMRAGETRAVVVLKVAGDENRAIAAKLGIGLRTVERRWAEFVKESGSHVEAMRRALAWYDEQRTPVAEAA